MKLLTLLLLTIMFMLHYVYAETVLVEVEQGKLSGEKLDTVLKQGSYYSFKGIPYAKPPVGSLRFMVPQPPLPWDGVRNATEHGEMCPQVNDLTNLYLPGSEDCLFLNVYTPNITSDSPLPVIIYIHGGIYKFGSGNDDTVGPDFLVVKGVVLVTINYRLDVLGFLSLDNKEVPGNMGLKDQVAAMKWVKKNIDKFGGNPDMITIFGQSAGGASVMYHVISPMSKGYFQRAISMSGSPYSDWSIPFEPAKRAFILGQTLGYDTKNKTDLLNFLQNVSYDKLINTNPTVLASDHITNTLIKLHPYVPVYEKDYGQEVFLPDDPDTLLKTKKINNVDLMTGYTNFESLTILPLLEDSYLSLYSRFLRNLPNPGNNSRYLYKFSSYTDLNVYGKQGAKYDLNGTAHLDDLMYLFSTKSFNITVEINTIEYEMIDKVTTLFTNFAKYGNPTPDSSLGIEWPLFNKETLPYMSINNTLMISTEPDEEHVQFWKSVLEDAGIDF